MKKLFVKFISRDLLGSEKYHGCLLDTVDHLDIYVLKYKSL